MSLSDLASLGSFVSGAAVLASLVFLFFQVRQMTEQVKQAERNQQALIRQGGRTLFVETCLARMEPSAADAIGKGMLGSDDISFTQYLQFIAWATAILANFEDSYFQHKDGLLSESAFAAVRGGFRGTLGAPGLRQYWEVSRYQFNFPDELVTFVDDLIAQTPVIANPRTFDTWKAGLAAMKANVVQH